MNEDEKKILEEKFQHQLNELISPKLTKEMIHRNYTFIAIGIVGVILCFGTAIHVALKNRLFPINALIITLAIFMGLWIGAYVYYLFAELKSGESKPRTYMKINLFINASFVFIIYFFYAKFALSGNMTDRQLSYYGNSILFFWIMAMTFVLWQTNKWNKEEIILEQKRTRLEIEKLKEYILQK